LGRESRREEEEPRKSELSSLIAKSTARGVGQPPPSAAHEQDADASSGLTVQAVIYSRDQHPRLAEAGKTFALHYHLLWI